MSGGNETTSSKAALPAPYNQDFTGIVRHVRGKKDSTRSALVNSPKVALYIWAGTTLINRQFGPRAQAPAAGAGRRPVWSGLRFLTQEAVIAEAGRAAPPFTAQKGAGPFRATWAQRADYVNDLLSFYFHSMNYEHHYNAESRGDWLFDGAFSDAIDQTTYREIRELCAMPMFRLQLALAATAGPDDEVRRFIAENYRGALDPWRKAYAEIFAHRGLRLRPGMSLDRLTKMLAAVAEGFGVQLLGDASAEVANDPAAGNIVGEAVMGLLYAFLEPAGGGPGRSLREDFDARF
ncbi:hypothetical protein ACQP1P_35890 [Dactylosporangium sp. CA-052675]|uniref:hypothetical protein n=1 Tax=Dactylosporangium sp. CA-052675 TaxID=3239927 RepID=UPI003D8E00E7